MRSSGRGTLVVPACMLGADLLPSAARRCRPSRWRSATGGSTVGGGRLAPPSAAPTSRRRIGCPTTPGSSTTPTTSTRRCGCCALDLTASVQGGDRVSVLGEIRSENGGGPQPYALYVRVRPWTDARLRHPGRPRAADLRRVRAAHLPADNPLIGYPLAYQYLTSLRPTRCRPTPTSCCGCAAAGWLLELLGRQPGAGPRRAARQRLPVGHRRAGARRRADVVDGTAAVTTGTLANPLFRDDNARPAGRRTRGAASGAGLVVGASAARGPFVTTRRAAQARRATAGAGDFTQTAWGADVEYSRDYYLLRFEAIVSDWRLPIVERAGDRRCRCAPSRRRSKDATRSGRGCTPRRASITSASARSTGAAGTESGTRR